MRPSTNIKLRVISNLSLERRYYPSRPSVFKGFNRFKGNGRRSALLLYTTSPIYVYDPRVSVVHQLAAGPRIRTASANSSSTAGERLMRPCSSEYFTIRSSDG